METTLKYGHFLTIHGTSQSQNQPLTGSLSAVGFTNNNIYIRAMQNPLDEVDKAYNVKDYNNIIFQIWPKLNCEANKEFSKLKKNHNYLKKIGFENEANPTDREFMDTLFQRIQKMEKRSKDEHDSNLNLLNGVIGQEVTYGSEVQFLHADSKLFLNGKILCSESDTSAYKFELTDSFNTGMLFKIVPRFKLREEGEVVQYKDHILFFNVKLNCFANFSDDVPIEIDRPIQISDKKPIYNPFLIKNTHGSTLRYEAYLSNSQDSYWQLFFHSDMENGNKIKGCDFIRLIHTEMNGELCADYIYHNYNPEIYIRNYFGDYEEENSSINSVWQIEIDENEGKGNPIQLSSEEPTEKPKKYYLRHFLTGAFLTVTEGFCGESKEKSQILCLFQEKKGTPIAFKPITIENSGFVENNSFYQLMVEDQFPFVDSKLKYKKEENDLMGQTIADKIQKNTNAKIEKKTMDKSMTTFSFATTQETFYLPLKNKELNEVRHGIHCKRSRTNENTYKIVRLTEEEQRNILFVNSAYDILVRFINIIKNSSKEAMTSKILKNTSNTLVALIFFVVKTENEDPIECEGIPLIKRQKIMKDMKIIELLTDILYWPFRNSMFDIKDLKEVDPEMIKIFQLSYRLIKHIIREYRPNEIYASQWLDLFMKQTMLSTSENNICADSTLTELIDNNKRILESKIKKETIEDFIDLLCNQELNHKYVKLLRAITTCDGNAMIGNQKVISEIIFGDQKIKNKLAFPLCLNGNEVTIQLKEDQGFLSLMEIGKVQSTDELKRLYEYFLEFIHLSADLCLDRNYLAIDSISEFYSLEIIYAIISNFSFSDELRYAFSRLMLNLWIDRSPFVKLILPNRIKIWTDLNKDKNYLPHTLCDISKFENLKKYVGLYIKEISYQKAYEQSKNKLTEATLHLCKNMVEFGFYTTIQEIEAILPPLLSLSNGTNDSTFKEEDEKEVSPTRKGKRKKGNRFEKKFRKFNRYIPTEDTLVVHNCKAIACSILLKLMQIRNDVRVGNFLSEFKKMIEEPLDQSVIEKNMKIDRKNKKLIENSTLLAPLNGGNNEIEEAHLKRIISIFEGICHDKEINFEKKSEFEPTAIFLDLALYKNEALINKAYDFLIMSHSNRKNIMNILKQTLILEDNLSIKIYIQLQVKSHLLAEYAEKTENWLGIEKNEDTKAYSGEKFLDLIEELINTLKKNEVDNDVRENEIEKELLIFEESCILGPLYAKNEKINALSQNIMRNMYIYSRIIDILKYDIETFSIERENPSFKTTPAHLKVLQKCYFFLGRFVSNNSENQQLLHPFLKETFLKHINTMPEVNAGLFMKQFLKNNKHVLSNSNELNLIIYTIVRAIEKLDNKSLIKINYLDSLKVTTKVYDRLYKSNQTQIITTLCAREFTNVLLLCNEENSYSELKTMVLGFNQKIDENSFDIFQCPKEINYLYILLDLLATTCKEENYATESKCQNYIDLKHLVNLIRLGEGCIQLRKSLFNFYFHSYLEIERDLILDKEKIEEITSILQEDLLYFSNNLSGTCFIEDHKEVISIKESKENYIILSLLPCLFQTLRKNLIKDEMFREELLKTLKVLVVVLTKTLNLNNPVKKNKFLWVLESFIEYKFIDATVKENIQKENTSNPQRFHLKKQNLDPLPSSSSSKQSKSSKLSSHLNHLSTSPSFIKKIESEYKVLVSYLINISSHSERVFKGACTIDFSEIARALIDLLRNPNSFLSTDLKVFILKIFRTMIELENPTNNNPASDWTGEEFNICKKKIVKRQNQLVGLGLVDLIFDLVSNVKNEKEIRNETILVAIALLLGGNYSAQEAFYKKIRTDSNNAFLMNYKRILINSVENVKKSMSHANKKIYAKVIDNQKMRERNFQETLEDEKKDSNIKDEDLRNIIYEDDANELILLKRLFRLLQLFCEGHNMNMQNILREQNHSKKGHNFNFVLFSASCFQSFIKFVNIFSMDIGNQLLDFMIESIQGPCRENQILFCKNKVIDTCKDFLAKFQRKFDYNKIGFINVEEIDEVNNVVTKSSKLLYSLIEGEVGPEIMRLLYEGLDFNFILNRLKEEFITYLERINVKSPNNGLLLDAKSLELDEINAKLPDHFDDDLMEAFNLYLLIITLADPLINKESSEDIKKILEKVSDVMTLKCLEFFKFHTKSIEVTFKKSIIRVYFPVHPICRLISKITREKFSLNVNRDTQNDKTKCLVKESNTFFDEITHLSFLKKQIFNISATKLNFIRDLSTILAFLINFFIIYAYSIGAKYSNNTFNVGHIDTTEGNVPIDEIINALGYIQLITSTTMLIMWVIIFSPVALKKKWNNLCFDFRNSLTDDQKQELKEKFNEDDEIDLSSKNTHDSYQILLFKGPEDPLFIKENIKIDRKGNEIKIAYKDFGNSFTKLQYYWISIRFLFSEQTFMYMIFYICISFYGVFISEISYCLHLFDVINRFQTLQNVIKSVTYNAKQLMLTLVFGLVLLYIYSIFAFFFFSDTYYFNNENRCTTLWQCYISTINHGLRNGGGIGDVIVPMSFSSSNASYYAIRFFFDLFYFASINIVFLNIIFGIIVDTFAELREKKNKMDDDMKNVCFICGINRYEFDRFADGFENHIERDHQLWFYVHYMYLLKRKNTTDYNGLESYVMQKIEEEDLSWLPNMNALSLNKANDDNLDEIIETNIKELDEKIENFKSKIEMLDKIKLNKKN